MGIVWGKEVRINAPVQFYDLRVECTTCKLTVSTSNLQVVEFNLQVVEFDLLAMALNLQVVEWASFGGKRSG